MNKTKYGKKYVVRLTGREKGKKGKREKGKKGKKGKGRKRKRKEEKKKEILP